MSTPSFPLGPPPAIDDPRRQQWDHLLWTYVTQGVSSENSGGVIAERVFSQRNMYAGNTPGLDVAEKQMILANQIFGG